jgi:hypothetical protein
MWKIGSAVDIRRRRLPLGLGVDQIHPPLCRPHVPNQIGACTFAAGEDVLRRRRDKRV